MEKELMAIKDFNEVIIFFSAKSTSDTYYSIY